MDATHAGARGIAGPDGARVAGDDLGDLGGAGRQGVGEPAETIKEIVDTVREP